MTMTVTDMYADTIVEEAIKNGFNEFEVLYNLLKKLDRDCMSEAEGWMGAQEKQEKFYIQAITNWIAITVRDFITLYFGDAISELSDDSEWDEFKNHPLINNLRQIDDVESLPILGEIINLSRKIR